jgi:hypothetical protein
MSVTRSCQGLERIINEIVYLDQVYKEELRSGDLVLISTQNSIYSVHVLQCNFYLVAGGWFDRNGVSPTKVKINGCTWGGNIIKTDIIAACGLHLEFSNGLVTSTIKKVIVFQGYTRN